MLLSSGLGHPLLWYWAPFQSQRGSHAPSASQSRRGGASHGASYRSGQAGRTPGQELVNTDAKMRTRAPADTSIKLHKGESQRGVQDRRGVRGQPSQDAAPSQKAGAFLSIN